MAADVLLSVNTTTSRAEQLFPPKGLKLMDDNNIPVLPKFGDEPAIHGNQAFLDQISSVQMEAKQ